MRIDVCTIGDDDVLVTVYHRKQSGELGLDYEFNVLAEAPSSNKVYNLRRALIRTARTWELANGGDITGQILLHKSTTVVDEAALNLLRGVVPPGEEE